ncbi:MAG: hypothetical protein ACRYFK_02895 [Janthinobacterium lividum]
MKATLLIAALALASAPAFAQTVAPGTTPGAATGNPSNMPSAGDPTTNQQSPDSKRMDKMDRRSKRGTKNGTMKMKTKTNADGTAKTTM